MMGGVTGRRNMVPATTVAVTATPEVQPEQN